MSASFINRNKKQANVGGSKSKKMNNLSFITKALRASSDTKTSTRTTVPSVLFQESPLGFESIEGESHSVKTQIISNAVISIQQQIDTSAREESQRKKKMALALEKKKREEYEEKQALEAKRIKLEEEIKKNQQAKQKLIESRDKKPLKLQVMKEKDAAMEEARRISSSGSGNQKKIKRELFANDNHDKKERQITTRKPIEQANNEDDSTMFGGGDLWDDAIRNSKVKTKKKLLLKDGMIVPMNELKMAENKSKKKKNLFVEDGSASNLTPSTSPFSSLSFGRKSNNKVSKVMPKKKEFLRGTTHPKNLEKFEIESRVSSLANSRVSTLVGFREWQLKKNRSKFSMSLLGRRNKNKSDTAEDMGTNVPNSVAYIVKKESCDVIPKENIAEEVTNWFANWFTGWTNDQTSVEEIVDERDTSSLEDSSEDESSEDESSEDESSEDESSEDE